MKNNCHCSLNVLSYTNLQVHYLEFVAVPYVLKVTEIVLVAEEVQWV